MNDQELAKRIQEGDEDAFRTLVDHHQEMVVNVCNSFLHNADDAMDVSQDVFIKIFESIHKYKGQAKLSTWIYRIAVNHSLNHIRSKKRRNWLNTLDNLFNGDENEKPVYEPVDESSQEKQIEAEEEQQVMIKALQKLPEKQKTALTLNSYEEMAYKEIAEVMQIPVNQVGVLINRARKNIQQYLIDFYKKN